MFNSVPTNVMFIPVKLMMAITVVMDAMSGWNKMAMH